MVNFISHVVPASTRDNFPRRINGIESSRLNLGKFTIEERSFPTLVIAGMYIYEKGMIDLSLLAIGSSLFL